MENLDKQMLSYGIMKSDDNHYITSRSIVSVITGIFSYSGVVFAIIQLNSLRISRWLYGFNEGLMWIVILFYVTFTAYTYWKWKWYAFVIGVFIGISLSVLIGFAYLIYIFPLTGYGNPN